MMSRKKKEVLATQLLNEYCVFYKSLESTLLSMRRRSEIHINWMIEKEKNFTHSTGRRENR